MENKKSPVRTFFILHRETILEAPPRFELGIKVLQTFALPLGYSADWSGLRGSNSLPPPWQGGALPDELNPHMATWKRFELSTSAVTGQRSNQLNYQAIVVGTTGLEPVTLCL